MACAGDPAREWSGGLAASGERGSAHAAALGFALYSGAASATPADARRAAAWCHAPRAGARGSAFERKHGSRGACRHCGTVGVSLCPGIQAISRCDPAPLSRAPAYRTSTGDVGSLRASTVGDRIGHGLFRPKSFGASFPSDAWHDPRPVPLVATLTFRDQQAGPDGFGSMAKLRCPLPALTR